MGRDTSGSHVCSRVAGISRSETSPSKPHDIEHSCLSTSFLSSLNSCITSANFQLYMNKSFPNRNSFFSHWKNPSWEQQQCQRQSHFIENLASHQGTGSNSGPSLCCWNLHLEIELSPWGSLLKVPFGEFLTSTYSRVHGRRQKWSRTGVPSPPPAGNSAHSLSSKIKLSLPKNICRFNFYIHFARPLEACLQIWLFENKVTIFPSFTIR